MAVESLGPRELADIADTIPDNQPAAVRPAARTPQHGPGIVVTHRAEGGLLIAMSLWTLMAATLLLLIVLGVVR